MAKGRFLSRSISTNEQVAGVSLFAKLLFAWMIPHIDVDGRLPGSPMSIKANIVPLVDEITIKKIPKLLEELGRAVDDDGNSLVVWYEVGRQQVLFFPGFAGQQTLRRDKEAPSKLPALSDQAHVLVGSVGATTTADSTGEIQDEGPELGSDEGPDQRRAFASQVQGEVEGKGNNQEEPSSSARARVRTSLHDRLASNTDRAALDCLLATVPNPESWIADLGASLDGMAGHRPATPIQLGIALREYAKNGATKAPNSAQFDGYLRRATQREERERSANGTRSRSRLTPGEQQVANIIGPRGDS